MIPFLRRVVVLGLAVAGTGCHDYLAIQGAPQPLASRIRATLTQRGTARVADAFGPYIVGLEGTLEGPWPADTLRLRVFVTRHEAGFRSDVQGVPVTLPATDVATTDRRKLNPIRTAMLGVTIGAVLVALPTLVQNAGGGGGSGGPSGPPQP